jgi:hypothetical protein
MNRAFLEKMPTAQRTHYTKVFVSYLFFVKGKDHSKHMYRWSGGKDVRILNVGNK